MINSQKHVIIIIIIIIIITMSCTSNIIHKNIRLNMISSSFQLHNHNFLMYGWSKGTINAVFIKLQW